MPFQTLFLGQGLGILDHEAGKTVALAAHSLEHAGAVHMPAVMHLDPKAVGTFDFMRHIGGGNQ